MNKQLRLNLKVALTVGYGWYALKDTPSNKKVACLRKTNGRDESWVYLGHSFQPPRGYRRTSGWEADIPDYCRDLNLAITLAEPDWKFAFTEYEDHFNVMVLTEHVFNVDFNLDYDNYESRREMYATARCLAWLQYYSDERME